MIQSILLIIAITALLYTIKHVRRLAPDKRKSFILKSLFYLGAGLIILLVVTGRLHWVAAGLAAILPVAQRLFFGAMRVLPFLRFWQSRRQQTQHDNRQHSGKTNSGKMSIKEAQDVLGLNKLESVEQVSKRHKEMMQKMHPDRGGSDYLAAQINQAKETLIDHLKS